MIPLSDPQSAGRFPFWTIAIIAVNVYVFYLEATSPNPDLFIERFALISSHVNFSNTNTLAPFVTSQFLHAGILHILANMWFLWVFGNNVEARVGFFLYPVLYLASGIAGGLAQYFILTASSIPTLGASGAIAGVLGAYFTFFPRHSIKTLIPVFGFFTIVDLPASLMLVYWFVIQIFSGTASLSATASQLGGVAYFAHIAGFIFGLLAAKMVGRMGRNPSY